MALPFRRADMIKGLRSENRPVHRKGDPHARMAEPVSRPMVLPVPHCVRTKVPQEVDLWPAEKGDRADIAGFVSSTRSGTVGRSRAEGPCPHVSERSAEVQCR